MYKAVFIDMDGTLLRKDHTISDVTKNTIEDLLKKGIVIVPISARPLHGILPITAHVFPESIPVVSLNGSYILLNKEIIYQAAINLQDTSTIHRELENYDVAVMYYCQMDWYATVDRAEVKKEQKITNVKIKIQPFEQSMKEWEAIKGGPNKILIAGDEKLIIDIEKKLIELHKGKLNIYKSQPRYLEMMSLEASKSGAVKFLAAKYGIKQNEIIAIGDNYNDKGMIEYAGMGIAMGNAPDEIKAAANYVTDTNNNDGVAKALAHFFA
jgi:hypothetical protein